MLQKARELSLECRKKERQWAEMGYSGARSHSPFKKSVFILRALETTKKVIS